VIHLAGKAHDTRNTADPQSYFDVNAGLTRRIHDRFLASNARALLFFSSVKAVADTVPGPVLTEETEPNPQTPYGQSKREAEQYILQHLPTEGRRIYILRPCMIHGPGNKGNLNLLHRFVSRGVPYPLGSFENARSFTSIANLCFVVSRLIRDLPAGGVYQMADDEPLSTCDVVRLMAEVQRKRPRIWRLNRRFVETLARVGDRMHLPLTTERLKKLTESYVVSNAKIKRALGIDALPVRAADGLRNTLESFKN
jgi:nucleoside-diphosphate-sugar epimerase